MKKTLLNLFLSVSMIGMMQSASAQCDGQRYYSKIFTNVDTSTVVYTDPSITTQDMDIYKPAGDAVTSGRKAILLFHGGSFVEGTRKDPFEVYMCEQFALRGYVTFSVDYRLATNIFAMADSNTAFPYVAKAISDCKAAMRYIKINAATLGVDTSNIVIGGESAGAIIADHMAYLTSLSQCTPALVSAFNGVGGTIEGNSGNPGVTSFNAKAVLSDAGALLYSGFMNGSAHTPVYFAQGDSDKTVPYDCGQVLGGASDVTTCGSGVLKPIADGLSITDYLHTFPGAGHCPWDTNTADLNIVEAETALFLYKLDCATFTSINEVSGAKVGLYPNPASTTIQIKSDAEIESVIVIDAMGRIVRTIAVSGTQSNIDLSAMSSGIYVARINMKNNQNTIVRSFVVE